MRPFFIFAFPRSGTAWLANYLTYGNSFCYHELLAESMDVEKLSEHLESNDAEYVGNSDCGNYLFFSKIIRKFNNPRIVTVIRDPAEIAESLQRNGYTKTYDQDFYEEGIELLLSIHRKSDSILVDFRDLFEERTARDILDHVTDCTGKFNRDRFNFLKNTNIQPENKYMKNKIERIRSMGMN